MNKIIRRIDFKRGQTPWQMLHREWLATNGLGGYASGTIPGIVTRRYHGYLIAALAVGRFVMLNHLSEYLRLPDGRLVQIGGEEVSEPHDENLQVGEYLKEFRLENGLPIWRYEVEGLVLEKHVLFLYRQNTVHINYHLVSQLEAAAHLELQPGIHFRAHDHPVDETLYRPYQLVVENGRYEVSGSEALPPVRMVVRNGDASFTHDGGTQREAFYPREAERRYPSRGYLWIPGHFTVRLQPHQDVTLICSTEAWPTLLALSPQEALRFYHERHQRLITSAPSALQQQPGADLVLAADQFIIRPEGRVEDAARAHASGDESCTLIAGYHWFTDWGRDTMISLEGLTLATNRHLEAGWVLRTFASYIRDGLIPNLFPEGKNQGLYHTADATLWFIHAVERYLAFTQDRRTLRLLLPKLISILEAHLEGTRFGIGVDPEDALLRQGAAGYQLTWMDAKVEDWVVTPRRGKAVEINALWYNALRLVESWAREEQSQAVAKTFSEKAQRVYESFNRRFWYEQGKYLYDVVDGEKGNDTACRPNQLLAISLKHPVLEKKYWKSVLNVAEQRLLTPVGLRSLSPDHPDYKPKYFGDLRARDAAYHQGTVWAWLIGPFVDAWLKVYPNDKAGARKALEGFIPALDEACIGSLSEIFDAEPPYTPRGCIAQAWSVAEALRCLLLTAESDSGSRASNPKQG